jgi:adenylosuccinate synthase
MWNPISLVHEAMDLANGLGASVKEILDLNHIDIDAPIITPFHVAANRIKESARGKQRHGSCGKGIGELASDRVSSPDQVLTVRDFVENQKKVISKLRAVQTRKTQELTKSGITVSDKFGENSKLLTDKAEPENLKKAYLQIFDNLTIVNKGFLENLLIKTSIAKRMEEKSNTTIGQETGMCRVSVYNVCQGRNLSLKSLLAVLDALEMDLVIRVRETSKRERGDKE